jgi:energy-coupling factor transporter ATP-binding protein EcfA2
VANGPQEYPPTPRPSGAAPPLATSSAVEPDKPIAKAVFRVPVFSGEVELELQGDGAVVRFSGLEAKGALPQLRSLCEQAGLSEKDYFAIKEVLRGLGLRLPEPPVPVELARLLPTCTPLEALELVEGLPQGDLGLAALLERAELEGWVKPEDGLNPRRALSKIPSHVRVQYAARFLEEWGLVRIVALKLSREGEERATGEAYEGRCAPVGDRILLPLERWVSVATRFFASALNREALNYARNEPTAVHSAEVPLERVNPWHLLRLKGWVLDLRDLSLAPPSLCDYWFTYQVDLGVSDAELRSLVESVKRGEYSVEENTVYRLWKPHFDVAGELEWEYFTHSVGTWLSPHRHKSNTLLIGPKDAGKSTLLYVLTDPLDPLTGRVPLSHLTSKDRFPYQPLIGKWINVYSEQLTPSIKNLQAVNNLVGESDWIYVDRKHLPGIWIRSLKSMLFASNAVPIVTSWDPSTMDAFIGRLSIVFIGKPEGYEPVPGVASSVPKAEAFAFDLWCRKQLEEEGWKLKRRSEEELLELLLEAQSPIYRFLAERCARDPQARVERKRLYEAFVDWLKERGVTAVPTRDQFYMQIRSIGFLERKWKGEYYFFGLRLAEPTEQGESSERKEEQALGELGRFAEG